MRELAEVLVSITNIDDMKKFMNEILTNKERKDLSLRWELMRKLENGTPQREIASKLGISLCKITRGAKILKNKDAITTQILNEKY
jgi:TrpR family trp operon transcriptional repressor